MGGVVVTEAVGRANCILLFVAEGDSDGDWCGMPSYSERSRRSRGSTSELDWLIVAMTTMLTTRDGVPVPRGERMSGLIGGDAC